jgi:hypothetical protein
MHDRAKLVSRPWRKFLRFSVRGLIVLVLVVGGCLGWTVRSARIQRDSVAAIRNAGGWVVYSWEIHNGSRLPWRKPWAPRWLVDLIGVDYFGHVIAVGFGSSSTATDTAMAEVGCLKRLEALILKK